MKRKHSERTKKYTKHKYSKRKKYTKRRKSKKRKTKKMRGGSFGMSGDNRFTGGQDPVAAQSKERQRRSRHTVGRNVGSTVRENSHAKVQSSGYGRRTKAEKKKIKDYKKMMEEANEGFGNIPNVNEDIK